jgi:hypothetical protein
MKPSLETCLLSVLASFGGKDKQQGQMPIYPARVLEAVSFTVGPSQEGPFACSSGMFTKPMG